MYFVGLGYTHVSVRARYKHYRRGRVRAPQVRVRRQVLPVWRRTDGRHAGRGALVALATWRVLFPATVPVFHVQKVQSLPKQDGSFLEVEHWETRLQASRAEKTPAREALRTTNTVIEGPPHESLEHLSRHKTREAFL